LDRQLCRFPTGNPAGDFTDVLESGSRQSEIPQMFLRTIERDRKTSGDGFNAALARRSEIDAERG
jgi:hypothetical protein